MGDVAMTVPILQLVCKTYPALRITVLSKPFFRPLFRDISNLDFLAADVYGKHKGVGLIHLANEAKALGITSVADLHNVIRSKILTNYLRLRNLRTEAIDKGRSEKKALTQAKGGAIVNLKTSHQRYADVFARLGLPIDMKQPLFAKPKSIPSKFKNLLSDNTKKIIGIAPFAAYKSKEYPSGLMHEVIQQLNNLGAYNILLFGGGNTEIGMLLKIDSQFENVTCAAGLLSFEEELDLISNLNIMLSMDSGNGHLAAMYGVQVVTLWGVTHPFAGFVPFAQPAENQLTADRVKYPLIPTSIYGNKYPADYENTMYTISPTLVVNRILEIVN